MIDEKKLIADMKSSWDMQDLYLPCHFIDLINGQPKVEDISEKVTEDAYSKYCVRCEKLPECKERDVVCLYADAWISGYSRAIADTSGTRKALERHSKEGENK